MIFSDAEIEISAEELEFLASKFQIEQEINGSVSADTQFLYAWGLVRSRHKDDMSLGIKLLESINNSFPDRKRECLYYLSIGHYRLSNYAQARDYINKLLNMEPENQQAKELSRLIDKKVTQDGIFGLALIGGAAAAALGIAFAVLRKRPEQ